MDKELTPAQRDEIQIHYLRRWLGKQKRVRWEITHGYKQPVKRFDVNGNRMKESR